MSDPEKLLKELARVAAEDQAEDGGGLDPRWDRLSHGNLSADEEAELRALAGESEGSVDAYEAFRPLGAEFQAGVVQAIQDQQRAETPAPEVASAPEPASASEPSSVPAVTARVLPFVRRHGFAIGGLLAAAAALVLLLPRSTWPPLPDFHEELTGGVRELRSEGVASEEIATFDAGSRFELVLRPETPITGSVAVRFFLDDGDRLTILDLPHEISASGAVRVAGEIGREIRIAPGRWTLWAALARPGQLPDPVALRDQVRQAPEREAPGTEAALRRVEFRVRPET